jgi:hypothetical protein
MVLIIGLDVSFDHMYDLKEILGEAKAYMKNVKTSVEFSTSVAIVLIISYKCTFQQRNFMEIKNVSPQETTVKCGSEVWV